VTVATDKIETGASTRNVGGSPDHLNRILDAFTILALAGIIAWTVFIIAPMMACGMVNR
jgi:hypothetical protein